MERDEDVLPLLELAKILTHPPDSIEILPGGLAEWIILDASEEFRRPTLDFPFLYTNRNLGIPKKVLYKLYLAAIALFKSGRSTPELCRISTSVILLTNPAHQTALNARKRLVQSGFLAPEKELEFTEVLFRGSSDCAKQSILWHHRRWLFGRVFSIVDTLPVLRNDVQPLPEIPPEIITKEFDIIRKACEAYSRNYYAWTHWHFIVGIVKTQLSLHKGHPPLYLHILAHEYATLNRWVDLHISDYSSMYHLCSLEEVFHGLELRYPDYSEDPITLAATKISLAEHALSLVTSYPSHESLWMYLRMAGALLSGEKRQELVGRIRASVPQSTLSKQYIAWGVHSLVPSHEE